MAMKNRKFQYPFGFYQRQQFIAYEIEKAISLKGVNKYF